MNISQAIKMSAKSIFSNKARSALTMLGIIIGLAAVIILVSYSQGQNMAMNKYYSSLGSNKVTVYAYSWRSGSDISTPLYNYCLGLSDLVDGFSPNGYVYSSPTIKYGVKTLSRSNGWYYDSSTDTYPQIALGNDQYGICNSYTIASGRELSFLDIQKCNQVCVLGSATAEDLFGLADPIGQTITINGMPFMVIGVYASKNTGPALTTEDGQWIEQAITRLDRLILLPSTMTRYFNNNEPIEEYVIKSKGPEETKQIISLVNSYLADLIDPNYGYGNAYSEDQWQEQNNDAAAMQRNFLVGIAAISLLVGGIGIMNIMLVTVTERTREIGIRKAIGAERKSIIVQFLIEAAMICGIGGIFGIITGFLGTMIICKISFGTIIYPELPITIASALISVAIGIVFGLYPAVKASGLQPVVALRAE